MHEVSALIIQKSTAMENGIPKYRIISDLIMDKIQSKKLPPDSRIPSENEIIMEYNVSNTTARKVLQELVNAGLVYKIRGKGTFVKDFIVDRSATKILSFTKNMRQLGLVPSTKVLSAQVIRNDTKISVSGKVYILPGPTYQLRRLRLANGVPLMVETRYISLTYCPEIWDQQLDKSLYEIYRKIYNLSIIRIEQDLNAIDMDSKSKGLFGIKGKSVGIKIEGITFCGKGMILEAEESVYRGDKYKFSIVAVP